MKKCIALLLILLLLTGISLAESRPYARQLPEYTYINSILLSQETFPEIRITPISLTRILTDFEPSEPKFVCFDWPAGAQPMAYSPDSTRFLDSDRMIEYTYRANDKASYEVFLDKATQDQYILLDGSEGIAAYIDPERRRAYGMVSLKEIGKSAKLTVEIYMANLDTRMPLEQRVTTLSNAILPEMTRLNSGLRYEVIAPFWTANRFSGFKNLTSDFNTLVCVDFPSVEKRSEDGSLKQGTVFITDYNNRETNFIYSFEPGRYLEVAVSIDNYSYPVRKLEENDPSAFKSKLSDGTDWIFVSQASDKYGNIISMDGSTALNGIIVDGEQQYFTVTLYPRYYDMTRDEYIAIFERFSRCIKAVPADQDPYVPHVEAPVQAPAEANSETPSTAPAAGSWTCPGCGRTNGQDSRFCPGCGTARPVETPAEWTCPNCGRANESGNNFCGGCGTPRPAATASVTDTWVCSGCGKSNDATTLFCPQCGTPASGRASGNQTPVSLKSLDFFQNHGLHWLTSTDNDSYGTPHSPSLYTDSLNNHVEGEYLLNRAYRTLNANLYVRKNAMSILSEDKLAGIKICVYGDDTLLYASPRLSIKDPSQQISIDVTGVQFLKITMDNNKKYVALGEPELIG